MTVPWAPLVDTHAHVFRRDFPFIAGSPHRFDRDFTIDDYIAELDASGVRYGVIAAASFLGSFNKYTLEALTTHNRLRGTVILDPGTTLAQMRMLDRAGVVGIRFSVGNMDKPPDLRSPEITQMLRHARDVDWHVHFFAKSAHTPEIIEALVAAEMKLVVDHFGARDSSCGEGSPVYDAILRALQTGRTWVKLSAPYWSEELDHGHLSACFLREAGAERLLWGSDWPWTKLNGKLGYRDTIDWLVDWLPNSKVLAEIDRSAAKLYRFE